MSIKELFDKGYSAKLLKDKSLDNLREDVESPRFIDAYIEKRDRFLPDVDYTTASNFARFGQAELYYENSIKRVYQTYPYDGSLAEKTEWENESTGLDLFIFENEYPRTNGHVKFNSTQNTYTNTGQGNFFSSSVPEYIYFKGGPNPDSKGDFKSDLSAGASRDGISKANVYHTASQRTNNLEFDLSKGATVEFWMKKDAWLSTSATKYETIFNLISSGAAGSTFGNVKVMMRGGTTAALQSRILLSIASGTTAFSHDHITGLSNISGSGWHHYALTAKKVGSSTQTRLYVDGQLKSDKTAAAQINPITGTLVASIGALAGPSNSDLDNAEKGWGNIIATSFDEFRYWKTERNAQQIGRNFRTPINGGTNTDNVKYDDQNNKIDLGVYFKFNEGITGVAATDKTILDYSGRISNGEFINYKAANRSIGSAIVSSSAAASEFKDPILYAHHPAVANLLASKKASGSIHDHENNSSLYRSMPGWILEDDEKRSDHLKFLTQIMSSFFDEIYLKMEKLPTLKDINYPYDSKYEKPLPFADRLLSARGYSPPELFSDADMLAKFLQRDERRLFEKKLHDVKNTIYQNIYNNLTFIQKSKGTNKSMRNFLRCFGVDEELIKFNIYASNDEYELKDNFTSTAYRKKYLDFDDPESRLAENNSYGGAYTATAYQFKDPNDSNSISYIPSMSHVLASGSSFTIETEVFFPKRTIANDDNYSLFPSDETAIFGLSAVGASDTDYAYAPGTETTFDVVATKPDHDRRNVKFKISSDNPVAFSSIETPETYAAAYDNEKWNLAFRLRPTRYPAAPMVSGSLTGSLHTEKNSYTYELYGVNTVSNIVKNEFKISNTMTIKRAMRFFAEPKRIYVGAKRQNYTGSILKHSDVKVSSTRVWFDYLSDEAIKGHARDASNYGALNPYENNHVQLTSGRPDNRNDRDAKSFMPQIKTLALNWTMDNVTGSDASGRFIIEDFTSGSASRRQAKTYGPMSAFTEYNYTGRGDFFVSSSAQRDQAVDIEFVQTARQNLPEVINSDDMVQILNKQDDVVFTRDTTYVQHILSVEKSMYQTISDEMLRMFSTIVDFNNLIGDPVNRYRQEYKKLGKIRDIFFDKVQNEPDLDKFIEYYKWIDDAITAMIIQLIPASSNTSEMLRNMVESHVLERNKYWTKFPTLSLKPPDLGASLQGIGNLPHTVEPDGSERANIRGNADAMEHAARGYKVLQPPLRQSPAPQNIRAAWWKNRAERDVLELSSGVTGVDEARNIFLKTAQTLVSSSEPTLKTAAGTRYGSSFFGVRSVSTLANYFVRKSHNLKAGSNPTNNKVHDFYKNAIKWGSDDDFIYIDLDNENKKIDIRDQNVPPEINKQLFIMKAYTMFAKNPRADFVAEEDDYKSTLLLPFSIYSSSFNTGYIAQFSPSAINLDFTNMHDDKYGPHAEIPLQGPFTEMHVGGMQHRHVGLNIHDSVKNSNNLNKLDGQLTRPEGWHLQSFLNESLTSSLVYEPFANTTDTATTDVTVLNLPSGSAAGDPGEEEYWRNGLGTDNSWSFFSGSTDSIHTGPSIGYVPNAGYAYCEVLPDRVGETFGLVTPLIDLLDVAEDDDVFLFFRYHMFGVSQGTLKVQACTSVDFNNNVTDLPIYWYAGNTTATTLNAIGSISGQQQTASDDPWRVATTTANAAFGNGLDKFIGKRFYLRFLYTSGILHLGDCAIADINLYIGPDDGGIERNSFKLFDATHDNHNRPRAFYMRPEFAKRPVNIRNIHMTSSSPTKAGNFLDRYQYVSTVSPEANDPWFVKNADKIKRSTAESLNLDVSSIEHRLNVASLIDGSTPRRNNSGIRLDDGDIGVNYTLLDRTFLTGSIRNRTRIKTKFSSPGGFEVMSRGFLDVAHETFSVYNAMTFRNNWVRKVFNSQLQAHSGRYGVSSHGTNTARVYGSEAVGTIRSDDYAISGDASRHKYHRNNIERLELSGSSADFAGMTVITASSFDNAFVSHMIPRTENQTRWITASLN
tara:strand:+ start:17648 stop:23620 length:5973 start_codon:yes stop_codon:yes gene_type:complete